MSVESKKFDFYCPKCKTHGRRLVGFFVSVDDDPISSDLFVYSHSQKPRVVLDSNGRCYYTIKAKARCECYFCLSSLDIHGDSFLIKNTDDITKQILRHKLIETEIFKKLTVNILSKIKQKFEITETNHLIFLREKMKSCASFHLCFITKKQPEKFSKIQSKRTLDL